MRPLIPILSESLEALYPERHLLHAVQEPDIVRLIVLTLGS